DDRPLFAFAGIWCTWHGTRGTQKAPEQGEHLLYGFLTTAANGVVAPIHAKAMPVILRTIEECDAWLAADPEEALKMQRPLPDDPPEDRSDGREGRPTTGFPSSRGHARARAGAAAMTDNIDIYRAAKLVIDRHGEEAALYTAARTAVLAGEGD